MQECIRNLPEKFLNRLIQIIPAQNLEAVYNSFNTKRPVAFRVNTLKIQRNQLIKKLREKGCNLEEVEWNKDAFILKNGPDENVKKLTDTESHANGELYIQSLSSMIPAIILDVKPGDKVLDIAAAPGSKTTQMAAMMENNGEIIANDLSRARTFKLRANLKQQGVTNTKVLNIPGQFLWKKFPEHFDKALVDAPCSLEGRIKCFDPKTFKDWSVKRIEILSQRERFLLRSAISAVKPGGTIVYSTCTLAPEENEEVIDWILKKENGAIALESISLPQIPVIKPITGWRKKVFDPQIKKTMRIMPSETMEGFFVAKIRKIRNTL